MAQYELLARDSMDADMLVSFLAVEIPNANGMHTPRYQAAKGVRARTLSCCQRPRPAPPPDTHAKTYI